MGGSLREGEGGKKKKKKKNTKKLLLTLLIDNLFCNYKQLSLFNNCPTLSTITSSITWMDHPE